MAGRRTTAAAARSATVKIDYFDNIAPYTVMEGAAVLVEGVVFNAQILVPVSSTEPPVWTRQIDHVELYLLIQQSSSSRLYQLNGSRAEVGWVTGLNDLVFRGSIGVNLPDMKVFGFSTTFPNCILRAVAIKAGKVVAYKNADLGVTTKSGPFVG
jgi:hypothetical protein